MTEKKVDHDYGLMAVVAIAAFMTILVLNSYGSLADTSLTGNVISEANSGRPAFCNDTDNGLDYYAKGRLMGDFPSNFFPEDHCFWGYFLREVYCKDGKASSHLTFCSNGCENGMCKEKNPRPKCGNGVIDGAERCDGANLNGLTCNSLGFIGGTLSCTKYCVLNISSCTHPVCGNGIKELGEYCDGNDLYNRTCRNFGFVGGALKCGVNCKFDTTECTQTCISDSECRKRICGGISVHETCENGKCVLKTNCTTVKCAKEGEYTSGTVSPEYQYGCCEGLKGFNTHPDLVGGGLLCYNPEKGTPECKKQGNGEGWYYPKTGQLLRADTCMKNISIQAGCTDSDRGINYDVKGSCYDSTQKKTYVDYCDEEMGGTKIGGLEEVGCQYVAPRGGSPGIAGNTVCVYNSYTCPNGCKDGACIKEPVVTSGCTDTDGGKNYDVKGTTTNDGISKTDTCGVGYGNLCGDGTSPIMDSVCMKSALIEYYCGGNSATSSIKVNGLVMLDNVECVYLSYLMDGYVSIGCGTFGTQRAPMGADGGFTITSPISKKTYKFYVINIETTNSDIRSAESLLMSENVRCPSGTCSDGACVKTPACGDGVINAGEECDGDKLNGMSCTNFGFASGILGCTKECKFDTTHCGSTNTSYCGDNVVQQPNSAGFNEQCDGNVVRVCPAGTTGGPVTCSGNCTFDYSKCMPIPEPGCGDGVRQVTLGEDCDGSDLGSQSCISLGFASGVLKCTSGCKFDTTSCKSPAISYCGDGIIQAPNSAGFNESCDGTNLNGKTCASVGNFVSGFLTCNGDCTFDYTGCYLAPNYCGDGKLDPGEECDVSTPIDSTCQSLGYVSGSLKCSSSCKLDKSGCVPAPAAYCGDNVIQTTNSAGLNEQCDGTDLGGKSCQTQGYVSGTLKCTASCTFDSTDCSVCNNNGVCQPRMGETVDNCKGDCILSPVGVALYTNPGAIDVAVGGTVTLDIDVSSITNLYGYQFDIEYDPNVLEFVSLTDGFFLSTSPFCVDSSISPGLIKNVACTRLGTTGVSGSGLLKKVSFKVLAEGASNIKLSNAKLVDVTSATIPAEVISGLISGS